MTAQHTPGPWSFQASAAHGYRIRTSASTSSLKFGSGDIGVVFFAGSGRSAEQCKADAKLIAASPRLFDALETLVDALASGAGLDFIEAFVRDASAALEEASPGWSKQDEPTSREMRRIGQVRAAAPDMLAALVVAREIVSTDRNSLFDSHQVADTGKTEPADVCDDYDAALLQMDSAIAVATRSQP